ncbi:hypothetical protein D3C87_2027740 [compost metagenome]
MVRDGEVLPWRDRVRPFADGREALVEASRVVLHDERRPGDRTNPLQVRVLPQPFPARLAIDEACDLAAERRDHPRLQPII